MPASRSRTERWFECLRQVAQRDGAIEITIPSSKGGDARGDGADLVWRVRIVSLTDDEIVVDQPNAAGQLLEVSPGVSIIAVMAIGQNRWMFRTNVLAPLRMPTRPGTIRVLRLAMPDHVERCQRRNFYRVSTAEITLPSVECWPLINPASVVAAEVANRAMIMDLINAGGVGAATGAARIEDDSLLLPEVGPRFGARLVNLGGGGAGLMVDRSESSATDRTRLYWLRVNLMPTIPAPLAMTARLVHTHIDSAQNLYAGMAFEWSFNAGHREFVVSQIIRYVGELQKLQGRAKAA